jgi:hypothetical protein
MSSSSPDNKSESCAWYVGIFDSVIASDWQGLQQAFHAAFGATSTVQEVLFPARAETCSTGPNVLQAELLLPLLEARLSDHGLLGPAPTPANEPYASLVRAHMAFLAAKQQEHAEASYDTARDQLQTDLVAAIEIKYELEKELAEREHKDKRCRLQTELLESGKVQQAITVELDKATTREKQAFAGGLLAEEARRQACAALERSNDARNEAEADLRAAEQSKVELARKLESNRAEYDKERSDCAVAIDLALEQKDVAALQKLSLAEDLVVEHGKVAEMEKALEAKDRVIADFEDHESRITQRLREEIMAKERAEDAENVLAAQLDQVLNDTGRKISDLQEQLVMEQSAGTRTLEENDLLAKQLVRSVTAHEKLTKMNQELKSDWQEMKRELLANQEASKRLEDFSASLEKQMRGDIKSREQTIDELGTSNRGLEAQLESFSERDQHMQRSCYAADIRHAEEIKQARQEIEQARKSKEEALKETKSTKENLEGKISEQAAVVLRLQLELEEMRSELARSVQFRRDLVREHDRLAARLQEALASKERADEGYANSRGLLQAMYQEEFKTNVQLERVCHELNLEAVEKHKELAKMDKELAKMEKDTSEREKRLIGHLEELRVWKEQGGVIALD